MDHPHRHLKGGRRRRTLTAAAALVAAAVTLAWTASTAAAYDVKTAAHDGMHTLMGSYDSSNGLIGTSWWQAAVALSTLMTYAQATGDASDDFAISVAFDDNKSGQFPGTLPNFEDPFMDDTGWWGVAWLQAYQVTGNARYLQMAETDANYIHGFWDAKNGGVWWNTSKCYKNAIPNELFLQLTAGLHNALSGDTKYLGWANTEWSWFRGSGLINSNGLVSDGLRPASSCPKKNYTATWTYNQGVILAGLTELSIATGHSGLLTTAQGIANVAILNLSTTGALPGRATLSEPCTTCGRDLQSFKGIFVRGLKELSNALGTEQYASFFENQVNSIIPEDTNSGHQMGFLWQGPVSDPNSFNNGITSYSQASAEDALVAGLNLGNNGTVLALASGFPCLDDYGSGTTAGNTIDVWACNSSPAQSWSTPAENTTGEMRVMGGCATVDGSTVRGTKVVWDPCTGSPQQQWTWHATAMTLYNAWSDKCMDNTGDATTNGNQVQIWTCNGDQAQTWSLP
jgi:predicted alpha-1,6-mannanase (GH76 family)